MGAEHPLHLSAAISDPRLARLVRKGEQTARGQACPLRHHGISYFPLKLYAGWRWLVLEHHRDDVAYRHLPKTARALLLRRRLRSSRSPRLFRLNLVADKVSANMQVSSWFKSPTFARDFAAAKTKLKRSDPIDHPA